MVYDRFLYVAVSLVASTAEAPLAGAGSSPYSIAVRELCEFTAKAGDLDTRFTPAPSAREGMEGHKLVAARRAPAYRTEISLAGRHRSLLVRGRADGYDPTAHRLEEFKTHRGPLERVPANRRALHWAQLQIYAALFCEQEGHAEITLALVYLNIGTQVETILEERWSAAALRANFEDHCERFIGWADHEVAHRARRDGALAALPFVHAGFRAGQRQLGEAVYRAAVQSRTVLAQAPTGIGKTAGTLFPALKALSAQRVDKIFFLTAKGAGSAVAIRTLDTVTANLPNGTLRVIALVAREKACLFPELECHGGSCLLARGFYDRLPAARDAARALPDWQPGAVASLAAAHRICPYFFTQELVRWADVVVGDYNYYFDSSAFLYAMAERSQWRTLVLCDEAHNLVERGRSMYSAKLDFTALEGARDVAPQPLQRALAALARCWRTLAAGLDGATPAVTLDALPAPLLLAMQVFIEQVSELADGVEPVPEALLSFYFALLHFVRLSDTFRTAHSVMESSRDQGGPCLSIHNLIAATFLAPRVAAARAAVFFSATLSPANFYRDTLGLPADTVLVDVASPFASAQLTVTVVSQISTRFRHRERSIEPITRLIAAQIRSAPGNYLAFFSSFDYLQRAAAALRLEVPSAHIWEQTPSMSPFDRTGFLERFTLQSQVVGFAVLGGSFAEGIDLPGARLIGAFIATLGMPQTNPLNEHLKERMERAFGAGHDYAYLYPGMRKVIQAAGRVIRSEDDRGVLFLIDDRFCRTEVLELLPSWWNLGARVNRRGAKPIATAVPP